ncbi:MAG: RNA polymerase sigma-54 factor 1 [Holosporales bacterium]
MIQNSSLDLRASQQLAMSPRLQQAIKLLQMSSLDLNAYVQEQLIDNPLLMEDEFFSNVKEQDSLILNVKNLENDLDFLNLVDAKITLKEHVLKQAATFIKTPAERFLVHILIDGLDENGYFKDDLLSIAQRFKIEQKIVFDVFFKLQECEPCGVFARSITECFELQLRDKNFLNEPIQSFLNQLHLLSSIGLHGLCKKINLSKEDGEAILNILKRLDPKPGLAFSSDALETVIPDVHVAKCSTTNDWVIELNKDSLPNVFLNTQYYKDLQSKCKKGDDLIYIKSKKTHASWLLSALEQRSINILKVAREIVKTQRTFFEKGLLSLSPLTLKEIAQKTDLHESTISRLTTNKYMQTPYGILDFKFFFNSKIKTNKRFKEDQTEISSKCVMENIKKFIQQEDKKSPLSDDDLSILLKQDGINIARRTISKYRMILKIGSSSERRVR